MSLVFNKGRLMGFNPPRRNSLSIQGGLTLLGAARKFIADMDTATLNNRFAFQTSTLNAPTSVEAIPNGTSQNAQFAAWAATDRANSSVLTLGINGATGFSAISSIKTGSGTNLPLQLNAQGVIVSAPGAAATALSVTGISTSDVLLLTTGATGANALKMTDGTSDLRIFMSGAAGSLIAQVSNHALTFKTNNTDRHTIAAAGNHTFAAPASGVTMTINGAVSGANPLTVIGGASTDNVALLQSGGANAIVDFRATSTNASFLFFSNVTSGERVRMAGDNSRNWSVSLDGGSTNAIVLTGGTNKAVFAGGAYTASKAVAFSATPTFDGNNSNYFDFATMTGNVTSSTFNNVSIGQTITVRVKQDGTGNRSFALPGSAIVSGSIGLTAGKASLLTVTFNGTDSRLEGTWTQLP